MFYYFFLKTIIYVNIWPYSFLKKKSIFKQINFFLALILYKYEMYLDGLYYRIKYFKKYHLLGFIIGFSTYILYKLSHFV